jgi:hypothetical protein
VCPEGVERILETVHSYGETVPDAFAGSYLSDDGERVMVGFVGDKERHAAALRSRVEDPTSFEVFEARFSRRELDEALEAAEDDGSERTLEADGFSMESGCVDVKANLAIVTIRATDPRAASAKARALYGPAVRVETVGPSPSEPRRHEIKSYELVGERTVRVHFIDLPRSELRGLSARELGELVTLDLVVNVWLGASRLVNTEHTAEVELSAPLGSRVVIDGSTGKRIPARDASWYAEQRRRDRY